MSAAKAIFMAREMCVLDGKNTLLLVSNRKHSKVKDDHTLVFENLHK